MISRIFSQVVEALEQDKEFAKKLENVSAEDIKSGKIAQELNLVSHHVRNKLDELKRVELDRLRKLVKQQHDAEQAGGSYGDSPDGRRWRTVSNPWTGTRSIANAHINKTNCSPRFDPAYSIHNTSGPSF